MPTHTMASNVRLSDHLNPPTVSCIARAATKKKTAPQKGYCAIPSSIRGWFVELDIRNSGPLKAPNKVRIANQPVRLLACLSIAKAALLTTDACEKSGDKTMLDCATQCKLCQQKCEELVEAVAQGGR
jgi:hypothetical protein